MSALYEISRTYLDFMDAVEAGDIPEEAVKDTLDGIADEFGQKAGNIACLVKSLEADAKAIKAEAAALTERRSAKERAAERLRRYLSDSMQQMQLDRLETPRCLVSFRKSSSVQIADEEDFKQRHPEFCKRVVTVEIMKANVREALKTGLDISGAELAQNRCIQIK